MPSAEPPQQQRVRNVMLRKACVLALFVLAWSFYSWTARSDGKTFVFERRSNDYYNLLTDGFLEGHLYLPVTPDPRLSLTGDPYDPVQNEPYRMQDVAFYHGKFYLYFGLAPAVTLLLPFRLIANYRLPERLAVAIFAFAGLVASYWSFAFIIRRFASKTPGYFYVVAVFLFGFCNFAPFILRRPAFYELAITSGYFYFFASVYLLLTGLLGERISSWRLSAAALCLGLTLASRPNYVAAVLVALFAAGSALLWGGSTGTPARFRRLLALGLPFSVVVTFLLTYNYMRFDNIFEFGQHFQLESLRLGKSFSSSYFIHNFRAYLLSTARIDRHFPFFHLRTQRVQLYSVEYGEPLGGVLVTTPLVGLVFVLIPLWISLIRDRIQFKHSRPLVILATVFGLNGFLMMLLLSFNGGLSERYVLDFIPSLLFSAIFVWILLNQSMVARPLRRLTMNAFLILLLVFQVSLNLGVSLTGYYDNLHEENPAAYAKIRSWFSLIDRR
jgi:hypothetical protein